MAENRLVALEFNESRRQEWNDFVNNSPWGDILQFWQWGEVKRSEGWTPRRIAVLDDGKLILAAQCLIKRAPVIGNYVYVPHGPVFQNMDDLLKALPVLKHALVNLAHEVNGFAIEIEPKLGHKVGEDPLLTQNLKPYTNVEAIETIQQNGFKKTGRNMQPLYKLFYDLDLSEEDLLGLMKKNTRYNVKLAEKKGVEVKFYLPDHPEVDSKLEQFYELLKHMQQRAKGYPIRPFSSFKSLVDEFKGTDNLAVVETSYQGDLIAINISERTKYWSSSFYAGSVRLHNEVKAPYLMRWKSVLWAKEYGSKVYDFWGIVPGSEQHQGYSDNKLSFGGTRIDFVGLLALPVSAPKFFIWNRVIPLVHKLKKLFRL